MSTEERQHLIVTRCRWCSHVQELKVRRQDWIDWQNGKLIQKAMPYLSADEREILISATCPKCWDEVMGGGNDSE